MINLNILLSRMVIMSSKRFYVGNLFPDVEEADLKKLFKKFGTVEKVEIKKKSDVEGKVLTTFAFVTVQISDDDVATCIQQFNNLKWKKHLIKVQQAQESFLSRLQREREEAALPKPNENVQNYDPISLLIKSNANTKKHFRDSDDEDDNKIPFNKKDSKKAENVPIKKDSKKVDSKPSTISFIEEEDNLIKQNNLEFKKSARVYHSSSEEEDDEEFKVKRPNLDVLSKLESFNR